MVMWKWLSPVLVAFVDHLQHRGLEGGGQALFDLVFHGHVSVPCPSNFREKP
jgi:hypothetical protein